MKKLNEEKRSNRYMTTLNKSDDSKILSYVCFDELFYMSKADFVLTIVRFVCGQ